MKSPIELNHGERRLLPNHTTSNYLLCRDSLRWIKRWVTTLCWRHPIKVDNKWSLSRKLITNNSVTFTKPTVRRTGTRNNTTYRRGGERTDQVSRRYRSEVRKGIDCSRTGGAYTFKLLSFLFITVRPPWQPIILRNIHSDHERLMYSTGSTYKPVGVFRSFYLPWWRLTSRVQGSL